MAEQTLIAWTDHTHNIAWGCEKISPGCAHCYADTLSSRYGHDVWGKGKQRRKMSDKYWKEPLKWNALAEKEGRRHRVFCSSMTDWALDDPTIEEERERLWNLIRETYWLDWQLLTKRADRIQKCLPSDWGQGYPNVWLGVSVEDQQRADERIPHLLNVPAVVRFLSMEPLLGPVDLTRIDLGRGLSLNSLTGVRSALVGPDGFMVDCLVPIEGIEWVIVGGESGANYRIMDHAWARSLRDQCRDAKVAFFFKQSSAYRTEMGIELDGEVIRQFPLPYTLSEQALQGNA